MLTDSSGSHPYARGKVCIKLASSCVLCGLWTVGLEGSSLLAGNDSGGECGVAVAKRFIMPDREADASENRGPVPSNAPFWYSFEYGAAHFTVISTEHDFHKHSDQRKVCLQ